MPPEAKQYRLWTSRLWTSQLQTSQLRISQLRTSQLRTSQLRTNLLHLLQRSTARTRVKRRIESLAAVECWAGRQAGEAAAAGKEEGVGQQACEA
jgi:hypothetical protein